MAKELNLKQNLLVEMLQESLTKSEFEALAIKLVKHIKKVDDRTLKSVEQIATQVKNMFDGHKENSNKDFDGHKNESISLIGSRLDRIIKEHNDRMKVVSDKIESVRDGKDADEEMIVNEVLGKIKFPEMPNIKEELSKMGEPIADALESLEGEERLDVKAIKGLKELFKEWKSENKLGGGTGGLRPSPSGVETPAGTLNGTNKAFTVTFTPQFITLNGQALYSGNGYTLTSASGVLTVTLDAAPASGELLRSHY